MPKNAAAQDASVIDVVIFDGDASLADTGELHRQSYNLAFRDLGVAWEWTASFFARLPDAPTPQEKLRHYARNFDPSGSLGASSVLDHIATVKENYFAQMIENGSAALRPGVARLIRDARTRQIPIAIAALAPRQNFEHLLQRQFGVDALALFDAVISRGQVAPQAGWNAAFSGAMAAGGWRPARSVAITGTANSAAAARDIGITTIATPGIYARHGDFGAAHLTISDLGQPSAPFQVIAGDPAGHGHITPDALCALIRRDERQVA